MQKVTDNILFLVLFAMVGTFILATAFILFFLKYQRRHQQQKAALQKAELEYGEQLLHATLLSQEDERKRIGRDLHDDVGASLSNLKMVLAQTQTDGQHKPMIDKIITTVRSISHSLSPPGLELFGLEHSLHELFDSFNVPGSLHIECNNEMGSKVDELDKQTALALYRVFQELLNNTIKHSGAKNVGVHIFANEGHIIFCYSDDGKGLLLDPTKKLGMGMQNIEARLKMINATQKITTAPDNGFKIEIKI